MAYAEKLMFLEKFLRQPKQIGSITPSSRALTRRMLEPVDWINVTSVAELGAGTGVFTREIRAKKRPDCTALIFERDDEMRNRLAENFPDLLFCRDARELSREVIGHGMAGLDAVISGLPFSNFSPELREELLEQVFVALKPGGLFVAFQYSLQMKKLLQHRFSRVDIRFVPQNVPFAFVYVCSK